MCVKTGEIPRIMSRWQKANKLDSTPAHIYNNIIHRWKQQSLKDNWRTIVLPRKSVGAVEWVGKLQSNLAWNVAGAARPLRGRYSCNMEPILLLLLLKDSFPHWKLYRAWPALERGTHTHNQCEKWRGCTWRSVEFGQVKNHGRMLREQVDSGKIWCHTARNQPRNRAGRWNTPYPRR